MFREAVEKALGQFMVGGIFNYNKVFATSIINTDPAEVRDVIETEVKKRHEELLKEVTSEFEMEIDELSGWEGIAEDLKDEKESLQEAIDEIKVMPLLNSSELTGVLKEIRGIIDSV